MLFHKYTTKAVKIAMFVVGILVIISMVLMYMPVPNQNVPVNQVIDTSTTTPPISGTSTQNIIKNIEISTSTFSL